jgi:hypothetical protein
VDALSINLIGNSKVDEDFGNEIKDLNRLTPKIP